MVLGNRIFSGYNWLGYEVRSVHELSHFIREGDGSILGHTIRLRETGPLTAAGLGAYLGGKDFHRRLFSAMVPDLSIWTLPGLEVSQQLRISREE